MNNVNITRVPYKLRGDNVVDITREKSTLAMRTAVIECGLELTQRKGIGELTLREIGTRLRVSRSAVWKPCFIRFSFEVLRSGLSERQTPIRFSRQRPF
jgi:hypothetical protein